MVGWEGYVCRSDHFTYGKKIKINTCIITCLAHMNKLFMNVESRFQKQKNILAREKCFNNQQHNSLEPKIKDSTVGRLEKQLAYRNPRSHL